MTVDALKAVVQESLIELCERQEELPMAAHLSVMEAFNACAEWGLPALRRTAPSRRPVSALLETAVLAAAELSDLADSLHDRLRYAEVHRLINVAVVEP